MQVLVFFFLVLLYFLILKPVVKYGKNAPFVPMDADVTGRIIKSLHLDKQDIFYDLGSGDGRLVILAALHGAQSYGVEMSRLKVIYSRLWIRFLGLDDKAHIIHGDIFDQDYSKATVVNCYLLQNTVNNLEEKLNKELNKGTRVVSTAFPFPKWKTQKIDPRGTIYGPIYHYQI